MALTCYSAPLRQLAGHSRAFEGLPRVPGGECSFDTACEAPEPQKHFRCDVATRLPAAQPEGANIRKLSAMRLSFSPSDTAVGSCSPTDMRSQPAMAVLVCQTCDSRTLSRKFAEGMTRPSVARPQTALSGFGATGIFCVCYEVRLTTRGECPRPWAMILACGVLWRANNWGQHPRRDVAIATLKRWELGGVFTRCCQGAHRKSI